MSVHSVGWVWSRVQTLRQAALRHRLEAARVRLARRMMQQADPLLHRVRLAGSTYTGELLALQRLSVPAALLGLPWPSSSARCYPSRTAPRRDHRR